jgi:hypothetical protein
MSLNHIVKGGLKDLALDVKSLSIQGQTVNPGGGGGNPFDQSLNTTDNVEFASVNMQDLQSSGNLTIGVPAGNLLILSPAGININSNVINTNSTITATQSLTLDNQLTTKEQVEFLIDTIVPTIIDVVPLEQKTQNQSASSGITNFDGTVNCDTILNTPTIKATNIYPTATSLKLNGDLAGGASDTYIQMNSTDMNIIANSDLLIRSTNDVIILQGEVSLNNTIETAKTTFTNPNELVSKQYVDARSNAYELIFAVTNQVSNIISTGQKFQMRAPRDFTISKFKLSLNTTAGVNFSVTIRKNGATVSSVFLNALVQTTTIVPETFLEDDIISVDVSNIGDGLASGLICYLLE